MIVNIPKISCHFAIGHELLINCHSQSPMHIGMEKPKLIAQQRAKAKLSPKLADVQILDDE